MKAIALVYAVALTLPVAATAGSCGPVKEYAQIKDQARTKQGRASLVASYCLYAEIKQFQQTVRDHTECTEHMGKIADALSAAHDVENMRKAADCGVKHLQKQ